MPPVRCDLGSLLAPARPGPGQRACC